MIDSSLNIVLTRKCYPCACNYCNVFKQEINNFWEDNFKHKKYFDKIIKDLIIFVNEKNIWFIRFFWGEVFLKKEILIYFVSKIREYWFKKDIFVNTNLHLFEKEDIDWIKKYNVKIITSLNWKEKIHIKTRWIDNNEFINLIENIKYIIKNKVYVQINTVLFPYEKEFIDKIQYILNLKPNKINLLPLMFSWLLKESILKNFIKKIDNLMFFINKNNLQKNFLNFDLIEIDKKESIPLLDEDVTLDSDGWLYHSMIIMESFFQKYKDLLWIGNCIDIKSLEIDKNNYKIIVKTFLEKSNYAIKNSIKLSNGFTEILLKNKK